MEKINEIINRFEFSGSLVECRVFGSGHINTTYLLTFDDCGKTNKYILQQVNPNVFKNIDSLMDNIFKVTSYLRNEIRSCGGDENREALHYIKTRDGKNYYIAEDGSYFRSYVFVENSVTYNSVDNPDLFKASGVAFGRFQRLLSAFPAESLFETIPDFHNTEKRFQTEFLPALAADVSGRAASCENEIEFVKARHNYCSRLVDLQAQGKIPTRVTHNDTKLNNVLFDKDSGSAICVIDLDTVMPGLALYDFGDSIRFGANTAAEDEADLSKVSINLDYFRAYAEGFLSEAGHSLNETEKSNLAFASLLMTFECGMRFLTDYLNGDVYFKTEYPEHNLVRAKNQLALVADMEKHLPEMEEIINDL